MTPITPAVSVWNRPGCFSLIPWILLHTLQRIPAMLIQVFLWAEKYAGHSWINGGVIVESWCYCFMLCHKLLLVMITNIFTNMTPSLFIYFTGKACKHRRSNANSYKKKRRRICYFVTFNIIQSYTPHTIAMWRLRKWGIISKSGSKHSSTFFLVLRKIHAKRLNHFFKMFVDAIWFPYILYMILSTSKL